MPPCHVYERKGKIIMANMYEYNDTMKFLGKQNSLIFCADSPYAKEIKEVFEAHEKFRTKDHNLIFEIGIDFFLLGFAMGKRAARKKKSDRKKWLV